MMRHIIAVGRTSLRKRPFLGALKSKGDWIGERVVAPSHRVLIVSGHGKLLAWSGREEE